MVLTSGAALVVLLATVLATGATPGVWPSEESQELLCEGGVVADGCQSAAARTSRRRGEHSLVQRTASLNAQAEAAVLAPANSAALVDDTFSPVDGGSGRACRGADSSDNSASNYNAHWRSMTLEACKALCVGTQGCRGIEHSSSKCEVWTRTIQATATSSGFECQSYEPFTPVDGGTGRACRGSDGSDNSEDHFAGPVSAVSLDVCKALCTGFGGCKGVDFGGSGCKLWLRPGGIGTSVAAAGQTCLRYEPFVAADGGSDRACRGANPWDDFASYYRAVQAPSLAGCKSLCTGTSGCKGVEYMDGRCKVWMRPGGVAATSHMPGAICLRFGTAQPTETGDSFSPADGAAGRACRGASTSDNLESYYSAHYGGMSVDECKALCVGTPGCKGVEHSSSKCEVWTQAIGATVLSTGFQCHRYEPFVPLDGGQDRACRGASSADSSSVSHAASTLAECKSLCESSRECKGAEFSGQVCRVWTQPILTTAKVSGSSCLQYEPFQSVDGGRDRACRGASSTDSWPSYYVLFTLAEVASLEECKAKCMHQPGCKGVQFGSQGCQVWTRPRGIGQAVPENGTTCLRYGPAGQLVEAAGAFWPADGGVGRSCRGASGSDVSADDYTAVGPSKAASLDVCKGLCAGTPDCRGVDFSDKECRIWTRSGGIGSTEAAAGHQCLRYEPFEPIDGGEDRACRGADSADNSAAHLIVRQTSSLQACESQCAGTAGCKGVEFHSGGRCELWTRPAGIGATVPAAGFQCLRYEPFVSLGGRDQACHSATAGGYQLHTQATLEACKVLCVGTQGCRAVEFSAAACKVWTHTVSATPLDGSLCLQYGPPDPLEDADAFEAADGAVGRACRGANTGDNSATHFTVFGATAAPSLEACKALCVGTPSCKGVEYSTGKCEVWTRAEGIGATVASPGFQCFRYKPFVQFGGFGDRACRGADSTDASPEHYSQHSANSLDACRELCVGTHGCKGLEYSAAGCKVWTRAGGVEASVVAAGHECQLYEPFTNVGTGADHACRGESASDNWPSYYRLYPAPSLEACKALCVGASDCKGLEYRAGQCEVWTRRGGIGSSVHSSGSLCLRYGQQDPLDGASAFVPADGGEGRACRGASATDIESGHYTFVGPALASSLEVCMGYCVATPTCQAIDYSGEGCRVWTRSVLATWAASGHTCLKYEPLSPVDGGADRACRGANTADNQASYYTSVSPAQAGSLQACQTLCAGTEGCKGLEYGPHGCELWTRSIGSSVAASGYQCHRFEPFSPAGGGSDQACRGDNAADNSPAYYQLHGPTTLEACKSHCLATPGCRGIEYSTASCKVWTRRIGATASASGTLCMRLGAPDPAEEADAFAPVDGAVDRACRGANTADNSASHYKAYTPAAAPSLDACKALCIGTVGCTGVEFAPGIKCEVWTRAAGIGASVEANGFQCFRYEPFELIGGFADRACRGGSASDSSASYYTLHRPGSLAACKALCVGEPGCKGVEYRSSGDCEVWARAGGIQASVAAVGSQCFVYSPFASADGGKDRACRGADAADYWPSYYRLSTVASLEACKSLCVGSPDCKGLQYNAGRCEVWTRRQGIGSTVQSIGSVCLRFGAYDPLDTASAFTPADRGTDRSCRGADSSDVLPSYYTLVNRVKANSLEACMGFCSATPKCKGVEYGSAGCKVWTRTGGVGSTVRLDGSECFRYEPFVPADGGTDRACRGAGPSDNSQSHYIAKQAGTLEACKEACAATPGCKGIEFSAARCEVWTRPEGIAATWPAQGFTCLRYEPFMPMDGGKDRSCRGGSPSDNSPQHYILYAPAQAPSLEACRSLCTSTPGCSGLEFNASGCAVWTRPAGIGSSIWAGGSVCLRYGAAAVGLEESWPRGGQIRLVGQVGKCLDVEGGSTRNGNNLQLVDCEASAAQQQFTLAGDGTGHIQWGNKCVDVSGGSAADGNNVQLWDCGDPSHPNMQFLLPGRGIGPIRWAAQPHKCLDISSDNVQIWSCDDPNRQVAQFILPHGSSFELRSTKYVTHYMPWFLGANADAACALRPNTCSYRDDHWCASYGNSFYASAKGAYDITQPGIIDQQLDEMRDAGLDGLWIDYQSANWDGVVNDLIAGARARGLGFAIVVDDTINPNIMADSRSEIVQWVREPHYFRHQGLPIVPVFNSERTVFTALPFSAIILSRAELAKPSWAADTYTWVHGDDGFLSHYYRQEHPMGLFGSAYRGFRDCYLNKSLGFPHTGMLGPSLELARQRKPAFVQLNTWNDYTEGTMLEPSWLRGEQRCVDVCGSIYDGKPCLTTDVCGSRNTFTDCTKPVGRALGPGPAACGATGDLSARAELDEIKSQVLAEREAEAALAGR